MKRFATILILVNNGIPLIAVWSNGDACSHCTKFENACNSAYFKNWMKTSGCVFFFTYPGDGGDGKKESKVFHWIRQSNTAYPFVRIYWPKGKVDVATVGDTVDGNTNGTTGGKNCVSYLKNKLKNFKPTPIAPAPVIPYTIEFDPNGATNEMPSVAATVGTARTLPANTFILPDYAFAGWALTATNAVVYKNKASVKNLTTVSNGVVTLYAKWTRTVYRGYDAGVTAAIAIPDCKGWKISSGATNEMASVDLQYGVARALPANELVYPDYSFAGWAKTATGAVAYKNKVSVKNLTTVSNGVVTLYAKWTRTTYRGYSAGVKATISIPDCKGWAVKSGSVTGMKWSSSTGRWTGTPTIAKTYTVTYKKGSSSRTRKIVVEPGAPYVIAFAPNGATNEMASVDLQYGIARALPANLLIRPDYSFAGWAKTATGAVAYKNQVSVRNLTTVSNHVVTLYAKWTRTTYRTYFTGVKTTISISDCKGWTKTSGAISGMTWNASTGKWTGTPKTAGTYTIKYKKGSSTKTRTIVVVTDSVVFADELAAWYMPGNPLQISLSPKTLAGDVKSIAITGLPDGLDYDPATGCVTGTPSRVGVFKVTVTVVSAVGQKFVRTFNVTISVPTCCIGTFNGFIGTRGQELSDPLALDNRGTFCLSAPSNANLSAKVVTAKGTYPLTGYGWIVNEDGSYTADLATSNGADKVLFTIYPDSVSSDFVSYGSFTPSYGKEYEVWAQRSPFERDESGAYMDPLVAENASSFVGNWYFVAYPIPINPSGKLMSLAFADPEQGDEEDFRVLVSADGKAVLAGKIGSHVVSGASSTVFVFADDVANEFVRADFAIPVSVVSGDAVEKKTLDIRLRLWFDRDNGRLELVGGDIGKAVLEEFD